MDKFKRYILSPLVVFLLLIYVHYTPQLLGSHWYNTLVAPIAGLAVCIFWSGLRANILSAVFITAYTFSHYEPSRAFQTAFLGWLIAVGCGWLRKRELKAAEFVGYHRLEAEMHKLEVLRERERAEAEQAKAEQERLRAEANQAKADFVDSLNGNISVLKELNEELIELIDNYNIMQRNTVLDKLNHIQSKVVNVAQAAIGWHQLYLERQEIVEDDLTTKRLDND